MSARAGTPAVMDLVDITPIEPIDGVPPWRDAAWLDEVSAWIDEQLALAGMVRTGVPKLRARMWSVVARVPVQSRSADADTNADMDAVWFKANPPGSAFEPGLLAVLGRWFPDFALPPLAVDTERAWTLSRDGGATQREVLLRDPDLRHLSPLLLRYARLQRALATHQQDLLALGLPDLRPCAVPDRFEVLLADPVVRAALDESQYAALAVFAPVLRARCEELDGFGIAASLDHSDLHPNNVFGQGESARTFDWGDGSLAHPFSTLLVLLRSASEFFDAEALGALRAAYLEPWLEDGYRTVDLERAALVATLVAPVSRATAWGRVFPCYADAAEPKENAARWLARLLDEDPLGALATTR